MGSTPSDSIISMAMRRARRRSSTNHRRLCKNQKNSRSINGRTVSDKLEALKNLIPSKKHEEIKADQLFQETANYIVLLKTQVTILQKLIDVYGSSTTSSGRDDEVVVAQENQRVV